MLSNLAVSFPGLLEQVLAELDNESLVTARQSSRDSDSFMDHGSKVYWYRVLSQHSQRSFQEFEHAWEKVFHRAPIPRVKQIAVAVDRFFQSSAVRTSKQVLPLFIGAAAGSVDLCTFIVNKRGDVNPKRLQDGATPLLFAAQEGHLEVYRHLATSVEDKNPLTPISSV